MIIENLEHSRKKFVFDVTKEEFEVALNESFKKNNANVTIKGFRKGHAPREMFEKIYGVEALYEDALNYIFNTKIQEIVKDEELTKDFVGEFHADIEGNEKIEQGKDFKVSLSIDVYPEVTLPEYKGIEVKAESTEVSSEEVEAAVNQLLAPKAKKDKKAEQVIEEGDFALFDFKGFIGDEAFEGGEAKNYELKIGSHQFIPGFEEQMVGMKAGETKDVNVTFPEQYGAQELASKDARFEVTVHEVLVEVLPELNDEFVKELNIEGVETVDSLKEYKKNELHERKVSAEKDRQLDYIINNILDNAKVDMPEALEAQRIDGLRSQYEAQSKMYNIPFDTFLQIMGTDKEKFEENITNQGKRQALFNTVITELINKENLAPSKEDMDAQFAKEGKDLEKLTQADVSRVYSDLAYQNVVKFLLENSNITE